MGKNNKSRRKNKKQKKGKNAARIKTAQQIGKQYTLCVTNYFVPGTSPEQVVRITAVVTDVHDGRDETVEMLEFWAAEGDLDTTIDEIISLAKKYDTEITNISETVPLEECPCGCGKYLSNRITSQDLARQYHSN